MTIHSLMLGLTAETAIHAGSSAANHVIDLPIMREHHTGWPVVFGSAVKGAFRALGEQRLEQDIATALFGPDTRNASDHAGSLLISDARLLLLPVRSLTTQFRFVTSPDLIHRWLRDRTRAGLDSPDISFESPDDDTALVCTGQNDRDLFLEEFAYGCQSSLLLDDLMGLLVEISGRTEEELSQKLTVVNDNQFTHLCQSAIPVDAHISINNETKTVKPSALWYEESLPPETVMYVVVGAQASRYKKIEQSGAQLLDAFSEGLFDERPYVQVGGNETTGMGWCKVQTVQEAKE